MNLLDPMPMNDETEQTDFGFSAVPLGEKQKRVDDVFHKVASRYDLMNDLMSGFLHRAWKDRLVTMLQPPKTRVFHHLDVAGGTGDVAFRVAKAGGRRTKVTVLDINPDMLAVGRARAAKQRLVGSDSPSSKAMPRLCLLPMPPSMPIRSPSASAMCRALAWRSARPIAC